MSVKDLDLSVVAAALEVYVRVGGDAGPTKVTARCLDRANVELLKVEALLASRPPPGAGRRRIEGLLYPDGEQAPMRGVFELVREEERAPQPPSAVLDNWVRVMAEEIG